MTHLHRSLQHSPLRAVLGAHLQRAPVARPSMDGVWGISIVSPEAWFPSVVLRVHRRRIPKSGPSMGCARGTFSASTQVPSPPSSCELCSGYILSQSPRHGLLCLGLHSTPKCSRSNNAWTPLSVTFNVKRCIPTQHIINTTCDNTITQCMLTMQQAQWIPLLSVSSSPKARVEAMSKEAERSHSTSL